MRLRANSFRFRASSFEPELLPPIVGVEIVMMVAVAVIMTSAVRVDVRALEHAEDRGGLCCCAAEAADGVRIRVGCVVVIHRYGLAVPGNGVGVAVADVEVGVSK